MRQFEQQHYGKHDELATEFEALWSNVAIILQELERHTKDKFHAKVFLTQIFVVSLKHMNALIVPFHNRRATGIANNI